MSETGLMNALGLLSVIFMLLAMAVYGFLRHLFGRLMALTFRFVAWLLGLVS